MNDKGELLVSTRSTAAGRKTIILAGGGFLIAVGVVGLLLTNQLSGMFGQGMMAELLWMLLCAIPLGMGVFYIIACFLGAKSYCDVYENAVVGTTGLSRNKNAAPQQNFELTYKEIVNVTESGKTIFLYTTCGNFEVLALKNRVEATQAIRKRMCGGAKKEE